MKKRKISVLVLVIVLTFNVLSARECMAAKEYYYKGPTINYVTKTEVMGKYITSIPATFPGFFSYVQYLTAAYSRCLTYYNSNWIANQGRTLSITTNKTVSRSVQVGVSAEIGVSKVVSCKVSGNMSTSATTQYSVSENLTYNLKDYKYSSYRIAAMGYYNKVNEYRYQNGKFKGVETVWGIDRKFGQEVRLVYRY